MVAGGDPVARVAPAAPLSHPRSLRVLQPTVTMAALRARTATRAAMSTRATRAHRALSEAILSTPASAMPVPAPSQRTTRQPPRTACTTLTAVVAARPCWIPSGQASLPHKLELELVPVEEHNHTTQRMVQAATVTSAGRCRQAVLEVWAAAQALALALPRAAATPSIGHVRLQSTTTTGQHLRLQPSASRRRISRPSAALRLWHMKTLQAALSCAQPTALPCCTPTDRVVARHRRHRSQPLPMRVRLAAVRVRCCCPRSRRARPATGTATATVRRVAGRTIAGRTVQVRPRPKAFTAGPRAPVRSPRPTHRLAPA